MTTNNETIKRNEAIKEFLAEFLEKLKTGRSIALHRKKQLAKYHILDRSSIYLIFLDVGINTLTNIQFKSVDDFASIKKLREAELFFSKTYLLEKFKFPDYKSHISQDFIKYVEVDLELDKLAKKALNLSYRGHNLAAREADTIVSRLRDLNNWHFNVRRIGYYDYKSRALEIIKEGRSELEKHRGYKMLLVNLILLISTIGTVPIINKVVTGHFLFFQKTDTAKLLDTISQTLTAANQISP